MSKNLTIDNLGPEASVRWAEIQEEIDLRFTTDVAIVHKQASAPIVDMAVVSEFDQLFELKNNPSWALFCPFKGYALHLKNLFQRKLMPKIEIQESIDRLDSFFESGALASEEEAESLYRIFEEVKLLDEISEEIFLNIFSCLKP
ncbi:MAG: hypothetical protein FJZ56_06840 [Chlamydiae bacterium]|nr:hypothetical protein [Chlamydiota bacterium]